MKRHTAWRATAAAVAALVITWAAALAAPGTGAARDSEEELLARVDQARGGAWGEFMLVMAVQPERNGQPEEPAEIEVYVKGVAGPGDESRQLVRFRSPQRLVGQVFLVVGANSWLYQPGLRRPLRISAQQKLFGDAGVAEAAGIVFAGHYRMRERREEEKEGQKWWHLFLEAKTPDLPYQRVELWVDPETYRPQEAVLASLSGTPLKRLRFLSYGRFAGGTAVREMAVENLLQKNQRTLLKTLELRPVSLPEQAFRPEFMDKLRTLLGQ
ncbi:MAG: outer membrane lipoprotein-sorting protein [Bacillota bacterium]|nr:outer membrane lipoprotein-sorting protein [Bacillota bacterium]